MSVYFFDLYDEQLPVADDEGAVFDSDRRAAEHALWCARDVIANDVLAGRPVRLGSCIAVRDAEGLEVSRTYLREALTILDE